MNIEAQFRDPRHRLLEEPTLLERLHRFEKAIGRPDIYLKRDDHMPIGMGGNKLRSLEYWLGAAQAADADIILVAGPSMSNQTRLTAAAAARLGLECLALHNVADTDLTRDHTFLTRVFGAETRFLGPISTAERSEALLATADALRAIGRRPYIVGDQVVGALGYAVAASELDAQNRETEAGIRHVFLPGSAGPTEAGFVFGNALLGNPFDVHLVSVEFDREGLVERVERIYSGLVKHTGLDCPPFESLPIHYHMDHLGEGYGKPSPEAEKALLLLARTEGVLTEFVYSAKTLAGLIDLTTRGIIPAGEPVCMIHTGGTASLFPQFGHFKTVR